MEVDEAFDKAMADLDKMLELAGIDVDAIHELDRQYMLNILNAKKEQK